MTHKPPTPAQMVELDQLELRVGYLSDSVATIRGTISDLKHWPMTAENREEGMKIVSDMLNRLGLRCVDLSVEYSTLTP